MTLKDGNDNFKECFDGEIEFNSFTARELQGWFYNLRNIFENERNWY